MAKGSCCVVCGKKRRIIPVNTVKYATQNTLPEVLSSAIGNKITCESWNDGNKHICYRCNRQCEEFDKINTRLEDLREHLLKEYTRRMFEESRADPEVPNKSTETRTENCIEGGVISDDDGATEKDDVTTNSKDGESIKDITKGRENAVESKKQAKPSKDNEKKRETARESEREEEITRESDLEGGTSKVTYVEDGTKDCEKNIAGAKDDEEEGKKAKDNKKVGEVAAQSTEESDINEKEGEAGGSKEGEKDVGSEKEAKIGGNRRGRKRRGNEENNQFPAEELTDATGVLVTIKTEVLDEEATLEDPEWHSENLPEHVDDDSRRDNSPKKQVIRLTEKTNLRRLPDYEYQQWYSIEGYSYVLHTKNNRGELLKCHKEDCGVSARVTQAALVKITGEHCHEPDRRIVERNELYAKLKERCMSDATTLLRAIYEEEAEKLPGGANCLPFPEVRMREWRAANDPTVVVHTDASVLDGTPKRYQCDVCNMGFNSSRLLIRHADKHNVSKTSGRKKLSGAKSFTISSPITVEKQKLKNKLDKTLKRVVKSLKHLDEESANDTENEATREKCQNCQKEFETLQEVKAHILAEHHEVLMCIHCDIAFDTPFILMRHQGSCVRCRDARVKEHREESSKAERKKESTLAQEAEDEMMLELSMITGQDASEDMPQDENDPNWEFTEADDSTLDDGDPDFKVPRKKRSSEPAKMQQCQVCEKTFPNQQQLSIHLYTHSSIKKYGCPCGETFNKKAVLTRHMLAKNHRGRININPPVVDSSIWKVTEGIRCIWDGTKFECAVCAATFNKKQLLLQHMRDEKHITDQIIIHDAQPPSQVNIPKKKAKKELPVYVPRSHNRMADELPKMKSPDGPLAVGGLRFSNTSDAVRAWYEYSGKKPFECAVCGEGFMTQIRLLAHMERMDHLSDSIVENVPELRDLMYAENNSNNNQMAPSEIVPKVKQESGINILSQVIVAPPENSPRQDHYMLPNKEEVMEKDQTYYLQTETVDGETVMVIQGDLDGSIHENMQLYMDEEGNIVTQDEDGNTIKIMQVDLSKAQEKQREQEAENSGQEMEENFQEAEDDSQEIKYDSQEMEDDNQEVEDDIQYVQVHNVAPGAGLYVDGTGQADTEENEDSENSHEYTESAEEAQEMMEDQEVVESEDRLEQTQGGSQNVMAEDRENVISQDTVEETQEIIFGTAVDVEKSIVKTELNLQATQSGQERNRMLTVIQIIPENVSPKATVESSKMKTRNLGKVQQPKADTSVTPRPRNTRVVKTYL